VMLVCGTQGCFASHGHVTTARGGVTSVGDLRAGDYVSSATDSSGWSRVLFVHDHKEPAATVELAVAAGPKGSAMRRVEVTPQHLVQISVHGAARLVPARHVKVGDAVYIVEKGLEGRIRAAPVVDVTVRRSAVRYVVTDNDLLEVDGVVSPVFSTSAGWIETLPFRFTHYLVPGVFDVAAVKASLGQVLESPALKALESLVNSFSGIAASPQSSRPRVGRRAVASAEAPTVDMSRTVDMSPLVTPPSVVA
jgi:hypothetical protein